MLSNEYLTKVAQLLGMTSHYETKLEEQRIKLSITPHFQARTIYNLLITDSKGIMRKDLINLFRNFILNISQRELDYIFQLYSSDNLYINWEDFSQLISPFDMYLDTKIYDNPNEQIVSDILQKLKRLLEIEVIYFRQAEPLRMILFEKYKENGKQFCALLEDNQKFISQLKLINFMNKQQYKYSSQDIFCLKKRIKCSEENISSEQFIKYCPLLPFKVMISKSPDYRLITIRQPSLETPKSAQLFKRKSIDRFIPEKPLITIESPFPQEEKILQQAASVPLLKQVEMSNYEFYTGKKPVNTPTLKNFRFPSSQQNYEFSIKNYQKNVHLQDYKATQQGVYFGQNQKITIPTFSRINPPLDNKKNQNQIIDKFLRPSRSRKDGLLEKQFIQGGNNQSNQNKNSQRTVKNDQTVKILDTNVLNEYMHPIFEQQDQILDSDNLTNTRKQNIFDNVNSNQQQLPFNTLFYSKQKFNFPLNSGNLNPKNQFQTQKMTQNYVTAPMLQEQKILQY
ncbi:unnamed protein product [Paramecium sonneborni]|uniref:Uncharacterized protein n=1 Tax=Paramecium sonneborni TaxID=65129 RepID=A0A8S1M2L6_9CILI|nr:unnamed protein product [Paramecium sonneborni]